MPPAAGPPSRAAPPWRHSVPPHDSPRSEMEKVSLAVPGVGRGSGGGAFRARWPAAVRAGDSAGEGQLYEVRARGEVGPVDARGGQLETQPVGDVLQLVREGLEEP